jgi:hypothetical protein
MMFLRRDQAQVQRQRRAYSKAVLFELPPSPTCHYHNAKHLHVPAITANTILMPVFRILFFQDVSLVGKFESPNQRKNRVVEISNIALATFLT